MLGMGMAPRIRRSVSTRFGQMFVSPSCTVNNNANPHTHVVFSFASLAYGTYSMIVILDRRRMLARAGHGRGLPTSTLVTASCASVLCAMIDRYRMVSMAWASLSPTLRDWWGARIDAQLAAWKKHQEEKQAE